MPGPGKKEQGTSGTADGPWSHRYWMWPEAFCRGRQGWGEAGRQWRTGPSWRPADGSQWRVDCELPAPVPARSLLSVCQCILFTQLSRPAGVGRGQETNATKTQRSFVTENISNNRLSALGFQPFSLCFKCTFTKKGKIK